MATYLAKVWTDERTQYPLRYKITHEDSSVEYVNIEGAHGEVLESGDVFDKATFDDMEARIDAGFDTCEVNMTGTVAPTASQGKNGDVYYQTETVGGVTSIVGMFVKISGTWLEVSVGGASLPQAEGSGF